MSKLRTAVVGAGYLGRYHAEKYYRSEQSELIAVVDVDPEAAQKVAKKNRADAISDIEDLIPLNIDCASVACNTSQHYAVAKFLLENDIDVLVEKPFTATLQEAHELIDIARRRGRILQIGHLERFNPALQAIKEQLNQPWFFEARRISKFAGRGHDVDVILDLMIHDIDIISHLVGRPLKHVTAVGIPIITSGFDIANARLTFEGGAVANVTASRAAFKSERSIRVFQPDLYVSLDLQKRRAKTYQKTGKTDAFGFPKIRKTRMKVEERDALQDQIESFLNSVLHRTEPSVSGEDGLNAMEVAARIKEEIYKSVESVSPQQIAANMGFK
jgi:predicted dehydrogenase